MHRVVRPESPVQPTLNCTRATTMTIRRLAQAFGLCCVAAFGMFLIIASNQTPQNGNPPAAPTLVSLEIPSGNGLFSGVQPAVIATASAPANYFVLPLQSTTAPIVRAVL